MAYDEDKAQALMNAHIQKTYTLLNQVVDKYGVTLPVLSKAMAEFTRGMMAPPEGTVCAEGCAYCCHLRVGVSIPELLVLFSEVSRQATPEGLAWFKDRVIETASKGDTLTETFWHSSQTPCPFLNGQGRCLIYAIRPFSCRAYHSTDVAVCRQGWEELREVRVPCFPLYRTATDMYPAVFIRVMKEKGLASFQVGLVKGLAMLFETPGLTEQWLAGKDVFAPAAF
ncbi:MAG TPA: hypothetical protein DHV36_17105 [Desulfobacteraceae bacterium]|nr:hypothetical protein [Desulfobacteraceae bacterium]